MGTEKMQIPERTQAERPSVRDRENCIIKSADRMTFTQHIWKKKKCSYGGKLMKKTQGFKTLL